MRQQQHITPTGAGQRNGLRHVPFLFFPPPGELISEDKRTPNPPCSAAKQRIQSVSSRAEQTEALLLQSEQHLRLFVQHAPTAIAMFDREMRYVAASPRWLSDYGLGERSVTGLSHYEVFPEISDAWKKIHQRGLNGEIVRAEEDRFQRQDGSVQWLRWEVRPWFQDDANIGGILIFTEDVTARKRHEEALKHSERRFRHALENMLEGCQILGFDWTYLYVNPGAARHGRNRKSALIGRRIMDVYPDIEKSAVWPALERCMIERRGCSLENEFEFPDGARAVFELSVRPVPEGILVLSYDITNRKHAERLLLRANCTLRTIRDCHEAMLRATTERELLQRVCQGIVRAGAGRMAWVGRAEETPAKAVRPIAGAGIRKHYLERARITWDQTARGRGPVGTAIRTGKAAICADTLTNPRFAPWRQEARKRGFGSMISLPLIVENKPWGALSIYAREPNAFDAQEQKLFAQLAADVSFGIAALRLRSERERLEGEILHSIEREQERIGRDLHDGLCQILVAAKFASVYLGKMLARSARNGGNGHSANGKPLRNGIHALTAAINGRRSPIARNGFSKHAPPTAAQEAGFIEQLLDQAITQARDLAHGLNPVKASANGLVAGLRALAAGIKAPPTVRCLIPRCVNISDRNVSNHLYRIAQEAVQNAVKHSGAGVIVITLKKRRGRIELEVKDNGTGFPTGRSRNGGAGFQNMRTRAALIGGRLSITAGKRGGSAITCIVPAGSGKPS